MHFKAMITAKHVSIATISCHTNTRLINKGVQKLVGHLSIYTYFDMLTFIYNLLGLSIFSKPSLPKNLLYYNFINHQ